MLAECRNCPTNFSLALVLCFGAPFPLFVVMAYVTLILFNISDIMQLCQWNVHYILWQVGESYGGFLKTKEHLFP